MIFNPSIEAMDNDAKITRVSRLVIDAKSLAEQKELAQMFEQLSRKARTKKRSKK